MHGEWHAAPAERSSIYRQLFCRRTHGSWTYEQFYFTYTHERNFTTLKGTNAPPPRPSSGPTPHVLPCSLTERNIQSLGADWNMVPWGQLKINSKGFCMPVQWCLVLNILYVASYSYETVGVSNMGLPRHRRTTVSFVLTGFAVSLIQNHLIFQRKHF